jgi:carboxyl-terminal processing protease
VALSALTRWIVAGAVVVTGACAPLGDTPSGNGSVFGAAFAGPSGSEQTLSFAYSTISERYLRKVAISQVAVDGIAGLATLDGAMTVSREGNSIRLFRDGAAVAQYSAPGDNDTQAWADLTMRVLRDSRGASERLKKATDDQLLKVVFDAALAKLDPFSRYSAPEEARSHRASRNGFAGVGIRYDDMGTQGVEIRSVIPESPAEAARLQAGDVLTHVDGKVVTSMSLDQVSDLLRGDIGSQVAMTLLRKANGRTETVTIRRSLVVPPTVSMVLENGVANIKISGFNQRTASSLANAVREARAKQGPQLKGVLLDLRGNPGGLLDQAVSMADLFMSHGRIVSTEGRHRHSLQVYDATPGDIGEDLPLAVLVDGKSASASEILTAALQDSGRAVVIGTNSYGKGTVQTVVRLPNDGEMTLTWSRFHSPSGYALHGLGVMPTVCTSEGKEKVGALVRAIETSSVLTSELTVWRSSGIDQTDLRTRLRATCPSEKHGDDAAESRLAEDLLQDRSLYSQLLSISSPAVDGNPVITPASVNSAITQAVVKAQ